MDTSKLTRVVVAGIAAFVTALPASAQQQAGGAPQPPQLERLEEGETPEASAPVPEQPRSVVTEKRAYGGRVTEIEVQSGKSRYYLQPNAQGGSSLPGDVESNRMRAPQWRIGEFDLRRGDDAKRASEAAATVPPPPAGQAPAASPGK
jgi:hypothetical protein